MVAKAHTILANQENLYLSHIIAIKNMMTVNWVNTTLSLKDDDQGT